MKVAAFFFIGICFFFFFLSFFPLSSLLWMASFLLAGRIVSSWDDLALKHHSSLEDLTLIPCKSNSSPQHTNRSLLLFELKRSGVYSQVCDTRKQTIQVVTYCGQIAEQRYWLWTEEPWCWRLCKVLCKDTWTALYKPSKLNCCVRGTWPRCFGTQAGSVPFCDAMAKLIKPLKDARS